MTARASPRNRRLHSDRLIKGKRGIGDQAGGRNNRWRSHGTTGSPCSTQGMCGCRSCGVEGAPSLLWRHRIEETEARQCGLGLLPFGDIQSSHAQTSRLQQVSRLRRGPGDEHVAIDGEGGARRFGVGDAEDFKMGKGRKINPVGIRNQPPPAGEVTAIFRCGVSSVLIRGNSGFVVAAGCGVPICSGLGILDPTFVIFAFMCSFRARR